MIVVSGWEKSHGFQVRLMQPISDWYVRAVRPEAKRRILDVASGTGIPALALAERLGTGGQLVATDVSPKMLAGLQRFAAAAGLANIETRETAGAAIGGADGAFDAVTCKDGLMFFPDIVGGLRELRRVLAPGGTYAFSVWAGAEHNPAFATMFGTIAAFTKAAPPPPDAR